jgi:hypothetical protein
MRQKDFSFHELDCVVLIFLIQLVFELLLFICHLVDFVNFALFMVLLQLDGKLIMRHKVTSEQELLQFGVRAELPYR